MIGAAGVSSQTVQARPQECRHRACRLPLQGILGQARTGSFGGDGSLLAAAGEPRQLRLNVSPDEQSILFSQVDHQESNLMLVEKLR